VYKQNVTGFCKFESSIMTMQQ